MNEAEIPIDIHTGKLQDWLISRRHVKKDWQKYILPVREKINSAIQDMPVHEGIAKLLSGTHINYFHCLKIIDILKETEADSKNLFGRYGSQRMKDWQEISKLYERDNLYLAEAASILVRNVNYEVPSLKKQIAKFEQLQTECDKKIADYTKKESTSQSEFNNVCKQIGISGDKIKNELVEKLKELPDMYDKICSKIVGLNPAIDLYVLFTKCIINEQQSQFCLPLIKYIAENGNTTVYEWSFGEPPLSIEPDPIQIELDVEENRDNQIDFGDDAIDFGETQLNSEDAIDFGDADLQNEEIDWGGIELENAEKNGSIENIDVNMSLEESGIVVEGGGNMGGVAKGNDALTLLDNPKTRTLFIDQLMELEAFLKMRMYEISADTQYNTFSSLQDLPIESTESVASMLDLVQVSIGQMMEKKINHLHNIKHSPRYVDTLAAQLKQKVTISKKMNSQIDLTKQKKIEAHDQAKSIFPILNLIIDKTKELQYEIEADISKKYNGRPVNLMGGIKSL
ncbi:CDK5 regulatory subunit-associated protein 3 isoform X2 [Arctopsyche grandis]|uniref:CDK5 regulatory subunit-associated protein 3 isoform X2 n=1 Tax=Arctopsyche grandis TaxID=121162 RepID=UPI00406D793B